MNEYLKTKRVAHLVIKVAICLTAAFAAFNGGLYVLMLLRSELSLHSLLVSALLLTTILLACKHTCAVALAPVPVRARKR